MPSTISALLIHGAGGGAWEWNAWLGVLRASGIDAHALELQPAADGLAATTLEHYSVQVRGRLLSLPRPRVLVGASLGGLLATMCAQDADALVLVNPLPCRPWNTQLPVREWGEIVRWQRDARLESTRDAMGDAHSSSVLFAFRRWRDESGAVLRAAWAGVEVTPPECPTLLIVSAKDGDVPPAVSLAMAAAWNACCVETPATTHVGPLLGKAAAQAALQAVAWLNRTLPQVPDSDWVGMHPH